VKITKLGHACLLLETPERTALFDPGIYSTVDLNTLPKLDDIIITHVHSDHFNLDLVEQLAVLYPQARITATPEIIEQLRDKNVAATGVSSDGIQLFLAPHEGHEPFLAPPQNIGVHYLGTLTHPGDSHTFIATKPVLALPVQAPWGSTQKAVDLALELKPKYIVPIHDWHWRDEARTGLYDRLEQTFAAQGITFIKAVNGQPFETDA